MPHGENDNEIYGILRFFFVKKLNEEDHYNIDYHLYIQKWKVNIVILYQNDAMKKE